MNKHEPDSALDWPDDYESTIPPQIWKDPQFPLAGLRVYIAFGYLGGRSCTVSYKKLAELLGSSFETVRKAISLLAKGRYIRIVRHKKDGVCKASTYIPKYPMRTISTSKPLTILEDTTDDSHEALNPLQVFTSAPKKSSALSQQALAKVKNDNPNEAAVVQHWTECIRKDPSVRKGLTAQQDNHKLWAMKIAAVKKICRSFEISPKNLTEIITWAFAHYRNKVYLKSIIAQSKPFHVGGDVLQFAAVYTAWQAATTGIPLANRTPTHTERTIELSKPLVECVGNLRHLPCTKDEIEEVRTITAGMQAFYKGMHARARSHIPSTEALIRFYIAYLRKKHSGWKDLRPRFLHTNGKIYGEFTHQLAVSIHTDLTTGKTVYR